jgi:two-component system, chemotaxis family, CheB/CheR fusion protein
VRRPARTKRNSTVELRSPRDDGRRATPAASSGPDPAVPAHSPTCPIVVVGASAGGLDAFKKLFGAMPPDSGLAFVLVPHLDPTHESLMVELVAKHTTMPVSEAADGAAVEPNHLYIIPPNKYLAFRHGVLLLRAPDPGGRATAIDFTLESLAEDQGERAIGIILSGTGSYGVTGLREIKQSGGMVMVQEPTSAQYDQMPRSAIEAGLADYILPPERMPGALVQYARHAYLNGAGDGSPAAPSLMDQLGRILALLRARTRYDFRAYRKNMLMRRVQRRMGLLHQNDLAQYAEYLREHDDEVTALSQDFLIGVTSFFRDPEAFQVLAEQIVGDLVQASTPDRPVRVWVPGCATGEESYSLAIILFERFSQVKLAPRFQLFATDVNHAFLEVARRGVYSNAVAADVSPERLLRFFVKTDEHHYQVTKQLRESVIFAMQNVVADAPFSRLDLISCRNLLMYLEPDAQHRVIALFHFALEEGGALFLGSSETIGRREDMFEPVSRKWRIYRRKRLVPATRIPLVTSAMRDTGWQGRLVPLVEPQARPGVDVTRLMQKTLLDAFAPAAVLIDRAYKILTIQGPVGQYLEFPPGELTRDLMAMVRQGLRASIRAAVQKAAEQGTTVVDHDARVKRNGRYVPCTLTVQPILEPKDVEGLLLLTFADQLPAAPFVRKGAKLPGSRARAAKVDAVLIARLESELDATRSALQTTIENYETAAEELKASNEEVMSMNEEFQSTNEELETSREELQSLNEELNTVNSQLQDKVDELDRSRNDLNNLLNSADIATLFLDRDLRIQRFTPRAAQLTSVRTSDEGRPIHELALKFDDPTLLADCDRVLEHLSPAEAEVWSLDRKACYLRRVMPYRTEDNRILGVVITLVDVTAGKQASAAMNEAQHYAKLIEHLPIGAVYLTDGRLTMNKTMEAITGYRIDELTTMDAWFAALYGPSAPKVRAIYDTDSAGRVSWDSPTITLTRKDGQSRQVEFAGCRIEDAEIWLLNDVTAREGAKRDVMEGQEFLRSIVDTATDAIVTIDRTGIIQTVNLATERMFGYTSEELIGHDVKVLMPSPYRDEHDEYLARYLKTGEARIIGIGREVQGRRKDGTTFALDLSVSEIGEARGFTGILRDITERKAMERRVSDSRAEEARNLAQELHDGLGGELTGVALIARSLQSQLAKMESPLAQRAGEMVRITEYMHQHLRDLARGLMPVELVPEGLMQALRALAERTATSGIMCEVDCPKPVYVDSLTVSTHVFRIAQEAVSNAVRHGKPKRIVIRLLGTAKHMQLIVTDDGRGMKAHPMSTGLGLANMRERARLLGGVVTIDSGDEGGTSVVCTIPLSEDVTSHGR